MFFYFLFYVRQSTVFSSTRSPTTYPDKELGLRSKCLQTKHSLIDWRVNTLHRKRCTYKRNHILPFTVKFFEGLSGSYRRSLDRDTWVSVRGNKKILYFECRQIKSVGLYISLYTLYIVLQWDIVFSAEFDTYLSVKSLLL